MRGVLQAIGIILLLLTTFMVGRTYFPRVEVEETIRRDTVWEVRDSTVYVEVPVPYEVIVPVETEVPVIEDCDSLRATFSALWVDHHTERAYTDTVPIDTVGYAHASFRVHQNRAYGLSLGYSIRYPTVTETVIKRTYELRGGIIVGRGMVTPTIGYRRGKWGVKVGYNVVEGDPYVGFDYTIFEF